MAKLSRSAACKCSSLCTSYLQCAGADATPNCTCRFNCCTTARVRALFSLCLLYSSYGKLESAELVPNWFRAGTLLVQSWFHVGSTCVHDSKACRRVQYSYFSFRKNTSCRRRLPGAELVLTGALPTGAERRAVGCSSSIVSLCHYRTRRRVRAKVVQTGALPTVAESRAVGSNK